MSKLLKKQVTELLESDATLADDKLFAYVKHWMINHDLSSDDGVLLLRLMRAVNPESFFRAWRQAQELNPSLRGKHWEERQREEVKVREEYSHTFHEKVDKYYPANEEVADKFRDIAQENHFDL